MLFQQAMRGLLILLVCLALTEPTNGLRFLMYNPLISRSHVTFMSKVADALVEAGHEVVSLAPVVEAKYRSYKTLAKVIEVPQTELSKKYEDEVFDEMAHGLWLSKGMTGMLTQFGRVLDVWKTQCNATLYHPGLIEQLKEMKFDVGFSEVIDPCGYALFHHLGLEKTAMMASVSRMEGSFFITGVPSFPSYVPGGMASFGERMTFLQRVSNAIGNCVMPFLFPYIAQPYEELFREKWGNDFPSVEEMVSKSSLFFLNSEPLIEFPRVTAHKIIDVGGITVVGGPKPLNKKWSDILELRQKTVLLSFGSVAKSFLMPPEYKNTIRETFRKFPDVTFIWKYEKPEDKISEGIDNIIEATWMPQNDLLYDRRLSLFITHCGAGSTTESTTAGVPLIVIPVHGDQLRNAQVIKRAGTGIALNKEDLNGGNELEEAIRTMLDADSGYEKRARLVGEMIRSKPFSAREVLVNNLVFLAKYGPLRQLDHYGKQLNFFQFYLIDVFAFLAFVAITILAIVFLLLRCISRAICRVIRGAPKRKSD